MRECTDRHCGNNPKRRVNPNDYDSVMGFLCDACEDYENEPKCRVCGERVVDHEDGRSCVEAEDSGEREILLRDLENEAGRPA